MHSKKTKFIAGCILVILAGAGYALVTTKPHVTLTPRSFTLRRYSDKLAQAAGKREYVLATFELTNASGRTITYWGSSREFPLCSVLLETPTGWSAPNPGGIGLQKQISLAPHSGITFFAEVERDKPCRFSLDYSYGKPSQFWQRMPAWLSQRVPWSKEYRTAVSATIDLRKAVDLPVEIQESFYKPTEPTAYLLRAAENGDTEARFKLAGRYWNGNCVKRSPSEALRWYESAATNGHTEAAYNLGTLYEYGLRTAPDRGRAIIWYRSASERGHIIAKERLQALTSAGPAPP